MVEGLPFYLMIGALAGTLGGLMGIGGGLVVVPALAFWFAAAGYEAGAMHMAVGTSLATIPFTLASALFAHARRGAVEPALLAGLFPGAAFGALAGALLVGQLSSTVLAVLFGIFLLLVAANMALGRRPSPSRRPPRWPGALVSGAVIGGISAPMGVAGGTLTVPWLVWHNVALTRAVGTATAVGIPVALAGVAGFVYSGLGVAERPPQSLGWVHWPAVAAIVPAAVLAAPLGARLAHTLPTMLLRRLFATVLAVVAVRMLLF
ncbi:MAG: sulfite exporter TauE/SafE family protein [Pseudomonadota bacterium]